MRGLLVILGLFAVASTAPIGHSGPMKISDNNIENIFNINININGVFTNHIEQDITKIVLALLNQQELNIGGGSSGSTLGEQLMQLAAKSGSNDLNVDVPASSFGSQFNFDGLENKIREAIEKNSADAAPKASNGHEDQAKELMQRFMANNSQLKL